MKVQGRFYVLASQQRQRSLTSWALGPSVSLNAIKNVSIESYRRFRLYNIVRTSNDNLELVRALLKSSVGTGC